MGIATPRQVSLRSAVVVSFPLISNVSPTPIASYNPDRVHLFISLPQGLAAGVNIGPSKDITAAKGSALGNAPVMFDMQTAAGLPCVDWFAIATGAGTQLLVIETFYYPPEMYTDEEANNAIQIVRNGHVAT